MSGSGSIGRVDRVFYAKEVNDFSGKEFEDDNHNDCRILFMPTPTWCGVFCTDEGCLFFFSRAFWARGCSLFMGFCTSYWVGTSCGGFLGCLRSFDVIVDTFVGLIWCGRVWSLWVMVAFASTPIPHVGL